MSETHDLTQRAEDLEHDLRLLKNELQADIVRDLLSALVQAEQEKAEGYDYLSHLFKFCAPQCKPLSTVAGLATQIDNYIAGCHTRLATQEAELIHTKAALAQCMRWRGEEREQQATQEATIRQVEDYIRLTIHNRIEQQIVVPTLMLEKWADTLRACTGETQK